MDEVRLHLKYTHEIKKKSKKTKRFIQKSGRTTKPLTLPTISDSAKIG